MAYADPEIYVCPACGEVVDGTATAHTCNPDRLRAMQFGEDPDEVEVIDPNGQIERYKPHEALEGVGLKAKRRTSRTPRLAMHRKAKAKRRKKRKRK